MWRNLQETAGLVTFNQEIPNPIEDGFFHLRRGNEHTGSLSKIFHTYLTITKLGTVIPYLKKS